MSSAGVVLLHGHVYCGKGAFAECVVFKDDVVIFVGDLASAAARWPLATTKNVTLAMPSFHDAHAHPVGAGMRRSSPDLDISGAQTVDAVLALVASATADLTQRDPVLGLQGCLWGCGLTRETLSSSADNRDALARLDAASGPLYGVVLRDIGGHCVWANSAVMSVLKGIRIPIPRSDKGASPREIIEVTMEDAWRNDPDADVQLGLFQGRWVDYFNRFLRCKSSFERLQRQGMITGLSLLTRFGISASVDAFVSEERVALYDKVYNGTLSGKQTQESDTAEGHTPVDTTALPRMHLALGLRSNDDIVTKFDRVSSKHPSLVAPAASPHSLCSLSEAKLEIDGAFAIKSAWTHDPYSFGDWSGCGHPRFDVEQVQAMADACVQRGWTCHFHTIGNRAVSTALDCLEVALGVTGAGSGLKRKHSEGAGGGEAIPTVAVPTAAVCVGEGSSPSAAADSVSSLLSRPVASRPMHKLAHVIHMRPSDATRFAAVNASAVMTPQWFSRKRCSHNMRSLPPEDQTNFMRLSRLSQHGAHVCWGSDWDVTTLNPLVGIEMAATQRGVNDTHDLWTSDRVDVCRAVDLYTVEASNAMGTSAISGTIREGMEASIVLLDTNIFECKPDAIHNTRVVGLVLRGRLMEFHDDAPDA